jgi:flagellar biosynthetic protein FlhB
VSEDGSEKRFDATPARRDRAKREGNAARSHEVASIAAFAGALLALTLGLPLLAGAGASAIDAAATHPLLFDPLPVLALAALAFVPATGAAIAGSSVSLAQTGGLRLSAVTFAFDKLAPLPGLKRMFGMEAVVAAARASISVAFAGMMQACFAAAGVGAVFALADFALVRRRWLHSLRMSFNEFKRDAREQDGDPQAKSRRKQLHRTLVRGGVARTREASFVIVNPTHIAIAIRYAPPAVSVPEIIVRAADAVALDVRAIAERERIPVIEDIPLARLLWRSGEAGRPIPAESFVAVAYTIAALVRSGVLEA